MFLFLKITWYGGNSSQDYIHKSGNYSITTEGYFQIVRIWNDIIYDRKYRNFYLLTLGICIPRIITQYKFLNNSKIVSNHAWDAIFTNKLFFILLLHFFNSTHFFKKGKHSKLYIFNFKIINIYIDCQNKDASSLKLKHFLYCNDERNEKNIFRITHIKLNSVILLTLLHSDYSSN